MEVIPIMSWPCSQMLVGDNRRGLDMNSANDTIMKRWLVSNVGRSVMPIIKLCFGFGMGKRRKSVESYILKRVSFP